MNLLNSIQNSNFVWRLLFTLCFISLIIASSDVAYATTTASATSDPIGNALCSLVLILKGNTAKAIGIAGIFFLGVKLIAGQMSWIAAAPIIIAIIVIFQAPAIVGLISGDTDNANCATTAGV